MRFSLDGDPWTRDATTVILQPAHSSGGVGRPARSRHLKKDRLMIPDVCVGRVSTAMSAYKGKVIMLQNVASL
jgi:hypothetical protein